MHVNLISSVVMKINQAQEPGLILAMKLTAKGQTLAFEKPKEIDGYQLSIAEDSKRRMHGWRQAKHRRVVKVKTVYVNQFTGHALVNNNSFLKQ